MKLLKLEHVMKAIYREMYKQATPSADFDQIVESGEGKQPMFFMKYYLSDQKQMAIIDNELAKHKRIPKWQKDSIKNSVLLGCSPCSSFQRWQEETQLSN